MPLSSMRISLTLSPYIHALELIAATGATSKKELASVFRGQR